MSENGAGPGPDVEMTENRTIAVLPFEDLAAGPAEAWFARGLAEDLITELSRFPQLEVIHAHSAFAEGVRELPDRDLGRELGARYVLRGTVRRGGGRVVVTTRLVDAESALQVGAERFEMPESELPGLELDIASTVASALALRIDDAHLVGARRKSLGDLLAYECWLRGLDHLRRGTVEDDDHARALFERALELDPHFARAHAGISLSHFNEWSCQSWSAWDEKEHLAFESARRAAELDDSDHVAQLILGRVHLFRREFDAAARRFELALRLNPNDADALVQLTLGLCLLGEPERARDLVQKAKRLNPKHGDWYFAFEVYVRFSLEEFEETLRLADVARGMTVDLAAYAASAAALLGRGEEAAARLVAFVEDLREKILFGRDPEPGEPLRWLLHVNPFRRPEDEQRLVAGLLQAGLAPDPDATTHAAPGADAAPTFRPDGDVFDVAFRGQRVRLGEVKGFHDLACLLRSPGEAFHCLELAGRPAPTDRADEVVDAAGRAELKRRARELQTELDQARDHSDAARVEAIRVEMDALVDTLSKSLGIGGRSRALGSASERARSAVTWRIRSAIRKIAAAHPALGRHLENSVRTGTFCAYEPERPVDWRL